ncbi:MAG: AraC family transcriptional regulator [Nocardia sp.]|uniref:AraC family transcriptional regulator n=1 Tax=Nocardia sp. TaxID=1821 RepID=UPI002638058D|nr:AraC family transcriptional regulator [Nocardia sp.]MCU1646262.1 AraC family transcriptional regulator [Nocardia sp.]
MPGNVASRSPVWDHPRAPDASRHLVETAEAHGVAAEDCLAGTGLTKAALSDPAVEVQASQELAIMRNLLAHVDQARGLGMEAGLRYSLGNTGILGYALLTSPTIGDAVTVARRYATLSSAFIDFLLHENRDEVVLEFGTDQIPDDVRGFVLERDLAAIAHVLPLLVGAVTTELRVLLEIQGFDFPREFLAIPGLVVEIEDNAARTAITFPRAVLELPMAAADPQTWAMCVQQCQQLLDRRTHRGGIAAQVRARLIQEPGQMPSMAAIAREYAMTERTLHRKLAAEQTSYRALVDEVRETIAVELLSNGLTVEEVARHLGYSETAAFTHAYIRWRGHPPSHQRKVARA